VDEGATLARFDWVTRQLSTKESLYSSTPPSRLKGPLSDDETATFCLPIAAAEAILQPFQMYQAESHR
jgi:hypothetical protein